MLVPALGAPAMHTSNWVADQPAAAALGARADQLGLAHRDRHAAVRPGLGHQVQARDDLRRSGRRSTTVASAGREGRVAALDAGRGSSRRGGWSGRVAVLRTQHVADERGQGLGVGRGGARRTRPSPRSGKRGLGGSSGVEREDSRARKIDIRRANRDDSRGEDDSQCRAIRLFHSSRRFGPAGISSGGSSSASSRSWPPPCSSGVSCARAASHGFGVFLVGSASSRRRSGPPCSFHGWPASGPS